MSKKSLQTLADLIDAYDRDRELSPVYIKALRCSARRFEKYLGRPATVGDLRYKMVNRWLQHESEQKRLSPATRAGGRKDIITLWQYSGRKLKKAKVRTVKVPRKNPQAWTFEQLDEVATASEKLEGVLSNGVPRAIYFRAIFYFAYETGLRRRDVWSFDFEKFAEQRSAITQNKTGNVHVVAVTDETMADLTVIYDLLTVAGDANARIPLRWPDSESQFYYWAKKLRCSAGIDATTHNRVLQHTRRTGATAVALAGGAAWEYLGHTHEGLDRLAYVDAIKTAKVTLPAQNRANGSSRNCRAPKSDSSDSFGARQTASKERQEFFGEDYKPIKAEPRQ